MSPSAISARSSATQRMLFGASSAQRSPSFKSARGEKSARLLDQRQQFAAGNRDDLRRRGFRAGRARLAACCEPREDVFEETSYDAE